MNSMFRSFNSKTITIDNDGSPGKHDSIALRQTRRNDNWGVNGKTTVINYRPIESWLYSDWKHKRRHLEFANLDFEPVRAGLFYSLRLGGTWVAADWWIEYFQIKENTVSLRLSNLEADINSKLLPLLRKDGINGQISNVPHLNNNQDDLLLEQVFNDEDRRRINSVNPKWMEWQNRVVQENQIISK